MRACQAVFALGLLSSCVSGDAETSTVRRASVAGDGDVCGVRGAPLCEAGTFCNFPIAAACGAADAPGTCEAIPSDCSPRGTAVCGCDGVTYASACLAAQAEVSVEHEGACATGDDGGSEPQLCGSRGMDPCPTGEYCNFGPDCGASDVPGTCTPQPSVRTCVLDTSGPVCGCDGGGYSSACAAAAAGVSVTTCG